MIIFLQSTGNSLYMFAILLIASSLLSLEWKTGRGRLFVIVPAVFLISLISLTGIPEILYLLLSAGVLLCLFRILFEGRLRMLAGNLLLSMLFVTMLNSTSDLLLQPIFGSSYSVAVYSLKISRIYTYSMLLTCLLLLIFCSWVRIRYGNSLRRLTQREFILLGIAEAMDSLTVFWIAGLSEYAGVENRLILFLAHLIITGGVYLQLILLFRAFALSRIYQEKIRITEKYLEEQNLHYQYLEKREADTKKYRHDMRSHLLALQDLYRKGKEQEADAYLDMIIGRTQNYSHMIQTSSNIADAVINRYYSEAALQGIEFSVKGNFPVPCRLTSLDLCTILSNLLGNALEGTIRCRGRQMSLEIRHDEKNIYLTAQNDCLPELTIHEDGNRKPSLFTSKGDRDYHGFGLENVMECIKSNHGWIQIDASGGKFCVIAELKNQERIPDKEDAKR